MAFNDFTSQLQAIKPAQTAGIAPTTSADPTATPNTEVPTIWDRVAGGIAETAIFLKDAALNPIDSTNALLVETGTAILNAPLGLFGAHLDAESWMFDGAKEFYDDHATGTQVASLFVGGGLAAKAVSSVMKLSSHLSTGAQMVLAPNASLLRVAKAKNALTEAGASNGKYRAALQSLYLTTAGEAVAQGLSQEAMFAALMQESPLLEDYDWGDFAVGAGLMGAGTLLLKGFPEALQARRIVGTAEEAHNAELMKHAAVLPVGYNSGEAATILLGQEQGFRQLAKTAAAAGKHGLSDDATRLADISRSDAKTKLEGLVSVDEEVTNIKPLIQLALKRAENPLDTALHGVKSIGRFKEDAHLFGLEYEQRATLITKTQEVLGENKAMQVVYSAGVKQRNMPLTLDVEGRVAKVRATLTKPQQKLVDDRIEADTTTKFMSAHTGGVHSAEELHSVGFGADFGITRMSTKPVAVQSNMQLQYTLAEVATKVNKGTHAPSVAIHEGTDYATTFGALLTVRRARTLADEGIDTTRVTKGLHFPDAVGKDLASQEAYLLERTFTEVKALQLKQHNTHEITLRTGLAENTVVDMMANHTLDKVEGVGIRAEMDLANEYKRQLVVLKGDSGQVAQNVKLDDDFIRAQNSTSIDESLLGIDSQVVHTLVDEFNPYNPKSIANSVARHIKSSTRAMFGTRWLSDATHALRGQQVADAATFMGRLTGAKVLEVQKSWGRTLQKPLAEISMNPKSLVEFNRAWLWMLSRDVKKGQTFLVQGNKLVVADAGEVLHTFNGTLDAAHVKFFNQYRKVYKESLDMENYSRKMRGKSALADMGIKPFSLQATQKFRAFVKKPNTSDVQILSANSAEELNRLVLSQREMERALPEAERGRVIIRGDDAYNHINDHAALENMRVADSGRAKTNAQYEQPPIDETLIVSLLATAQNKAERAVRKVVGDLNQDTLTYLERMEHLETSITKNQGIAAKFKAKSNVYATLRNTMLDTSDVTATSSQRALDEGVQLWFNSTVSWGRDMVRNVWDGSSKQGRVNFEAMKAAYKDAGMEAPYTSIERALEASLAHELPANAARKVVSTLSGAVSFMALRFMESAHAAITVMSTPIMLMPELQAAMRASGNAEYSMAKLMSEGIRTAYGGTKANRKMLKRWADQGIVAPHVAELSDQLAAITLHKGVLDKVAENKIFKLTTKLSDRSEVLVRQWAAGTGYQIAKKVLPRGHTEVELDAYVAAYVNRTMGNYTTSQRPTAFQGVIGQTFGLFQTFMLTYAQSMLRNFETSNRTAIATMMAAQGTIFGMRSLPMYDEFNQLVGEHMGSNQHDDITSTVYEKLGAEHQTLAEAILYGLPSTWAGGAFFTRAQITARSPVGFSQKEGFNYAPAALAPLIQGANFAMDAMTQVSGGNDVSDAMHMALQQQTLSRPLARWAELASGSSVDGAGRTIDAHAEAALNLKTVARIMGVRPLQEQALRDMKFLDSYYGKLDSENKSEAVQALRGASAVGELSSEVITTAQRKYFDAGGSPRGWTAAYNEAILGSSNGLDFAKEVSDGTAQDMVIRQYGAIQ